MTPDPREPSVAGVSASLAVVFATVAWFALLILGLGMLSYFGDRDLFVLPGIGSLPMVVALAGAGVVFSSVLRRALRHMRFTACVPLALVVGVVHALLLGLGVLVASGDIVRAAATAGESVTGGMSAVVLLVAAIAAWGGIALCRTRAQAPRWPWENDDSEE